MTADTSWWQELLSVPPELGDRVQVGGHAGDVIDLRIFKFTLLEIGNWVAADQSTTQRFYDHPREGKPALRPGEPG